MNVWYFLLCVTLFFPRNFIRHCYCILTRYEVAGGQHYFRGVQKAIEAKTWLKNAPNLQTMRGEIYAMGWLKIIEDTITKGQTVESVIARVPRAQKLTLAEQLELKELTVPIAIATLVREHNEVADLHATISNEQMIRYMRDVWQRSAQDGKPKWTVPTKIPEQELRAIVVFTGLQEKTVFTKMAVAMADEECWAEVEKIWTMHKNWQLKGQENKAPKPTKGKKTADASSSQKAVPKTAFNVKRLEDILSLPLHEQVVYALKNLTDRKWSSHDVPGKCNQLRSIARLAEYFVETVTWDFKKKCVRENTDPTWTWLKEAIPNYCNEKRLQSVYDVGYKGSIVPKKSCRSDVQDMTSDLTKRMKS